MKIITSFTATLAASLLLAGSPMLASADEMQSGPVQINNVQFNQIYTPDNTTDPGLANIAFTNAGSMDATDVVFAVRSNGNIVEFFDASGTFAPGVTIDKEFPAPSTEIATDRDLTVESVTYADGSVWLNPGLAVPDAAAMTQDAAAPQAPLNDDSTDAGS